MIKPSPLQTGDTVTIVAPARKITVEDLAVAVGKLESWGLHVVLPENISSQKHSYLAGTDAERLEDFQQAINDANIKAIICARGGYGSTRIIDRLDFAPLARYPKWIVGFSDITAVHLSLFRYGMESIHGTMPALFAKPDAGSSFSSLKDVLFGSDIALTAKKNEYNRCGSGRGEVVGGNLSLIVDSFGTPSEPNLRGTILVLEEIDEYLYKIDRMLMQLKRSGKLHELAGLVLGHFTDIKDTTLPFGESVEDIVLNAISGYGYPVAFGFPTGHQNPNLAWRHGATGSLIVNTEGSSLGFETLT